MRKIERELSIVAADGVTFDVEYGRQSAKLWVEVPCTAADAISPFNRVEFSSEVKDGVNHCKVCVSLAYSGRIDILDISAPNLCLKDLYISGWDYDDTGITDKGVVLVHVKCTQGLLKVRS